MFPTKCSQLDQNFGDATYTFVFTATDDVCPNWMSDNYVLHVKVSDLVPVKDFLPPNVFTPNYIDDLNPVFHIPDLPEDNCRNAFERIVIYNRWGKEVYTSSDRDFAWDGEGAPTGFIICRYFIPDRL